MGAVIAKFRLPVAPIAAPIRYRGRYRLHDTASPSTCIGALLRANVTRKMKIAFRLIIAAALVLLIGIGLWPSITSRTQAQQPRAPILTQTPPPQKPARVETEPEAEVVRVETDLVNTLFTAVDRDRHFVTTLRSEDVRIFENDVQQTVSMFQRETDRPLSLAILIDTSESQRGV